MANAWGELSWSQGSWGEQNNSSVPLTGLQVNCVQNDVNVAIGQQVDVTSQQLNLNVNSVNAFGLALIPVNGIALTANLGSLDPAPDAEVTGEQLNILSPGNVTITAEINSGWGRLGWGEFDWGINSLSVKIDLIGFALEIAEGNEESEANTIISINGFALKTELDVVDVSPDAELFGEQIPILVNSVSIEGTGNVTLTGFRLDIAQGNDNADALTLVNVTGEELVIYEATPLVPGTATIYPIGIELSIEEGIVDPSPDATVTGIEITVGVGVGNATGTGNVDDVVGVEAYIISNTVGITGGCNVFPIGLELTITTGSPNIQAWQIVDTGTSVNWNIIDTAA